ncbi:hypothetical protein KJ359_004272 [Pestalotiopsis sp. 9143b]|nr:hypothetical protein KJ359_004272 [Pestalotiopsis sp. 9143b]
MAIPYEYTPLKAGEIRLLHHSIQDGQATWTLQPVQLREQGSELPVQFDALSYTWGDLSHTFPFQCNGSELRIHENLKNALPYLAQRRSSLPIWIDAVCINQSDNDEKFVQISMMHSIYRQATQVWVWLGSDPGREEEAIALLPKIATVGKEIENQPWTYLNQSSPVDKGLPAFRSPQWNAVTKISTNKWFLRLWIVQEAALAKKIRVLYGQEEISWDVLGDAVDFAADLRFKLRDADGYKPPDVAQGLSVVFGIRNFTQSIENQEALPFALMRHLPSRDMKRRYNASRGKNLAQQPGNSREISMCGKIFDTVETLFPELLNAHKWQFGTDSPQEAMGLMMNLHAWEKSLATAVLGNKVEELPDDPTTVVIPGNGCRVQFTLDDYWRSLVGNMLERDNHTFTYEAYRAFVVGLARYGAFLATLPVDFDSIS